MKQEYIDQYGIDSLPHLLIASASGCQYFVTTNKALLKDRKELEQRYKIKIRTPQEMCENVEEMKDVQS